MSKQHHDADARGSRRQRLLTPGFDLRRHLVAFAAIALVGIAAALWLARRARPIDLWIVPTYLLVANVVEYLTHRLLMHRPLWPRALYRNHTLGHHRAFHHQSMEVQSWREMDLVLMPWFTIVGFLVLLAPVAALIAWAFGPGAAGLMVLTAVVSFLLYEGMHALYHFPHPVLARLGLDRSRAFTFVYRHHRHHHRLAAMRWANFNISLPLSDRLFGTLEREERNPSEGSEVDGWQADRRRRRILQYTAPMALPEGISIAAIEVEPLSIPLREPFVIATGRMDVTRAALVRATLEDSTGRRAVGLGEGAALPPVTREDQPELLATIAAAAPSLRGVAIAGPAEVGALLDRSLPGSGVARAGVEAAILDAWARLAGLPLCTALGGSGATELLTDITLPISDPARMATTAAGHRRAGFACFKVKVGRDWQADLASLRAVAAAVPDARFRLDANAGFAAREALALLDAALADGLTVECYEQPCGAADLAGMAEVAARSPVPVVADESFRAAEDLDRLLDARAAHAVNLKLGKLHGPLSALALGRRARAAGLRLMAGAMVETRVGLLAMAHVVAALGGVDWVDLDTAFLLAADPFDGGWTFDGPRLRLAGAPGLGVTAR